MTLDEAIKHAEEIAEEQECRGYCDRSVCVIMDENNHNCDECEVVKCRECAKEHRQLAEWLKELKAHRSAWKKLKNDIVAYHNNYDYDTAMHFLNTVVGLCTDIYDDTDAGGDADASNN